MIAARNHDIMSEIALALQQGIDYPEDMERRKVTHTCPHCGYRISIPAKTALSYAGKILTSLRKTRYGKAPVIYSCPCGGFVGTARELRQHHCDQKPPRGKESAIIASRREAVEYMIAKYGTVPPHIDLNIYPE